MRLALCFVLVASATVLGTAPLKAQNPPPGYFGIPDGFDYPADKTTLEQYRRVQNLSALRRHSWMLFAGMTQTTPDGTPYWETWFREGQAFAPEGPVPQGPQQVVRRFSTPNQFRQAGVTPQAPGKSVMTFVLFNYETYHHIRSNEFYKRSKLLSLNASFPAGMPWDQRKVTDFPARAMSLKTIWWPAAGDAKTPLPVWDNDTSNPAGSHSWDTWSRIVAVDGTRQQVPPGETATISWQGTPRPGTNVVGLDRFYHFQVTAQAIDTIKQAIENGDAGLQNSIQGALGRELKVGDYMLFLGFHTIPRFIEDSGESPCISWFGGFR